MNELLYRFLRDEGHSVTTCVSGVEALQKLHTAPAKIDLLITDECMAGSVRGLDLVRIARTRGYRGPVLVASGRLTPEVEEEYRTLSVAFLPKPFDLKRLLTFVT